MSDRVFDASVERIRRYCEHSGQPAISVSFHGGEPCPIRSERFAQRCDHLRSEVGDSDTLHMVRQIRSAVGFPSGWAVELDLVDPLDPR